MLLEQERKPAKRVATFKPVETALRRLCSYGPSSFAVLTADDGSFIQFAGGGATCVLEWRRAGDDAPRRAYLARKKVQFEGPQVLMFGGGHMQMAPEEILFADDVVAAFRAFFEGGEVPGALLWREPLPG